MYRIFFFGYLMAGLMMANVATAEDSSAEPDEPAVQPKTARDPSLIPAPTGEGRAGERTRLLADFNGDGREDLALSMDNSWAGNAGNQYFLYLKDDQGRFVPVDGTLFAHPGAIAIDQCGNDVRIWTFWHGSARDGQIGYQELKGHELSELKSINLITERGCSAIGEGVYRAVFSNSDVPIRVEVSTTVNGVVHWKSEYEDELEEAEDEADEAGPGK